MLLLLVCAVDAVVVVVVVVVVDVNDDENFYMNGVLTILLVDDGVLSFSFTILRI